MRCHEDGVLSAEEFQKVFDEVDRRVLKEVSSRLRPLPGDVPCLGPLQVLAMEGPGSGDGSLGDWGAVWTSGGAAGSVWVAMAVPGAEGHSGKAGLSRALCPVLPESPHSAPITSVHVPPVLAFPHTHCVLELARPPTVPGIRAKERAGGGLGGQRGPRREEPSSLLLSSVSW